MASPAGPPAATARHRNVQGRGAPHAGTTTTDATTLRSTTAGVEDDIHSGPCGTSPAPRVRWWFINSYTGVLFASASWTVLLVCLYGAYTIAFFPWLRHGGSKGSARPAFDLKGVAWAATAVQATLFTFSTAMALWSHAVAMLSDPGACAVHIDTSTLAKQQAASRDTVPVCHKCHEEKPQRAHHCNTCGRCILGMDHHCPWVNNCVGDRNRKSFCVFLVWTLATCVQGAVILVQWLKRVQCGPRSLYYCVGDELFILVLGLAAMCLLFGAFVATMLVGQVRSILNNTTAIDRMKGMVFRHGPAMEELRRVFGERVGVAWLWPGWIHHPSPATYSLAEWRAARAERQDWPGVAHPLSDVVRHAVASVVMCVCATRILGLAVLISMRALLSVDVIHQLL